MFSGGDRCLLYDFITNYVYSPADYYTNHSVDPCIFDGYSCFTSGPQDGYVNSIDIGGLGIRSMPEYMLNFQYMNEFEMEDVVDDSRSLAHITTIGPDLQYLFIDTTKYDLGIPAFCNNSNANLTELIYLSLTNLQLNGTLGSGCLSFETVPNLTFLDLSSNPNMVLEQTGSDFQGNFMFFRVLYNTSNYVRGIEPPPSSFFTGVNVVNANIQYLNLSGFSSDFYVASAMLTVMIRPEHLNQPGYVTFSIFDGNNLTCPTIAFSQDEGLWITDFPTGGCNACADVECPEHQYCQSFTTNQSAYECVTARPLDNSCPQGYYGAYCQQANYCETEVYGAPCFNGENFFFTYSGFVRLWWYQPVSARVYSNVLLLAAQCYFTNNCTDGMAYAQVSLMAESLFGLLYYADLAPGQQELLSYFYYQDGPQQGLVTMTQCSDLATAFAEYNCSTNFDNAFVVINSLAPPFTCTQVMANYVNMGCCDSPTCTNNPMELYVSAGPFPYPEAEYCPTQVQVMFLCVYEFITWVPRVFNLIANLPYSGQPTPTACLSETYPDLVELLLALPLQNYY